MKTTNLSILSFIQSTFNEYHVSGREPGSRAIMTKTEPNSQRNHVSGREGGSEGGRNMQTATHTVACALLWSFAELGQSSLGGSQKAPSPYLKSTGIDHKQFAGDTR